MERISLAGVILNMAPNVDMYVARGTEGRELYDSQAENVAKVSINHLHIHHLQWCVSFAP